MASQTARMLAPDAFKCVIQYMIANGCVPVEEFQKILEKVTRANQVDQLDDGKIFQIVQKLNKKLKAYHMMIRLTMDEISTCKYYVLISTVDNEATHAASHYNQKQFEFFKLILQAIVLEPRGILPEKEIKALATKATIPTTSRTRSTLPEYKKLFNEWCNKNWLMIVSEDGEAYVTLGVRSTAELDVFIKQRFLEQPDDLNCKSCQNMAIYSVICSSCNARYHKRCSKMSVDLETGTCRLCMANGSTPVPSTSRGNRRSRIST